MSERDFVPLPPPQPPSDQPGAALDTYRVVSDTPGRFEHFSLELAICEFNRRIVRTCLLRESPNAAARILLAVQDEADREIFDKGGGIVAFLTLRQLRDRAGAARTAAMASLKFLRDAGILVWRIDAEEVFTIQLFRSKAGDSPNYHGAGRGVPRRRSFSGGRAEAETTPVLPDTTHAEALPSLQPNPLPPDPSQLRPPDPQSRSAITDADRGSGSRIQSADSPPSHSPLLNPNPTPQAQSIPPAGVEGVGGGAFDSDRAGEWARGSRVERVVDLLRKAGFSEETINFKVLARFGAVEPGRVLQILRKMAKWRGMRDRVAVLVSELKKNPDEGGQLGLFADEKARDSAFERTKRMLDNQRLDELLAAGRVRGLAERAYERMRPEMRRYCETGINKLRNIGIEPSSPLEPLGRAVLWMDRLDREPAEKR